MEFNSSMQFLFGTQDNIRCGFHLFRESVMLTSLRGFSVIFCSEV